MSLDIQKIDQLHHAKQQGFVLILALGLLAVLTLIGVSSMQRANMELRATANAQQHQMAFNGVQSLIEFTISDTGTSLLDFQTTDTTPQTLTTTMPDTKNLSATMVLAGCSIGVGSSLSGKGFSYNFFNITGTGSNKTGTSSSLQTQGVRYPVAACGI